MSGCKIAEVADAISKLTIAGVTVKDIDQIPTAATVRDVFLFPKPDGFVSGLTVTQQSQGYTAIGAKFDVDYTLTYTLATGEFGAGRANTIDFYSAMVGYIVKVINAVTDINVLLDGAVSITVSGVESFGSVLDPAGNPHPGTNITFAIKEFYEVA
jgi:hypothetical protein